MEATQPARYVPMPVTCSSCNERQIVHLAASTGFRQMGDQEVECLKCHDVFRVMVPDTIIAGPFPVVQ
jgi:ribosomal protein S27E